jgi:hypothetical protein
MNQHKRRTSPITGPGNDCKKSFEINSPKLWKKSICINPDNMVDCTSGVFKKRTMRRCSTTATNIFGTVLKAIKPL